MKRLTLLVIPHTSSGVREFSIRYGVLWVVAGAAVLLLCGASFYAIGYHTKIWYEAELVEAQTENAELVGQIRSTNAQIYSLKEKMALLAQHGEMLRVLAELERPDSVLQPDGIGGALQGRGPEALTLSPQTAAYIEDVQTSIDELLQDAEIELASFEEIERRLHHKREILDHTPSIVPAAGYFSSGFGFRRDPFTGRIHRHQGTDIANRVGTPVYAAADGIVVYRGYTRAMGNMIVIDHKYGHSTYYGHLSKFHVDKGKQVRRWDKIGEMGNTGRSTGPHLHYGVKYQGRYKNPWGYFYSEHSVDVD